MTVFAWLCAAASVVLGAIYMFAAAAPQRYILVNAASLVLGVAAAAVIGRVVVQHRVIANTSGIAVGLLMVATALAGIEISGASRWLNVAGISLQPSLALLPLTMVCFAWHRSWPQAIGLAVAGIGVAMQPDRAMAGVLVSGLAVLWVHHREPPVSAALAAAVAALGVAAVRDDVVAPVLFVEQVVFTAFAFHALTGVAIVAALVAMLLPAAVGLRARTAGREVFAVFGATWLAAIVWALIGNYPTPLAGYGSSAIIGYCLSAGCLPSRRDSTAGATAP